METKEEYERYQKASKKVQEIKGFYSHLIAYLFVIPIIAFVNIKYTPEHFWFFYPIAEIPRFERLKSKKCIGCIRRKSIFFETQS